MPRSNAKSSAEGDRPPVSKRGRGRHLVRGQDGLFDVVGAELITRVVQGELGVHPPRRPGWLAKQLKLRGSKSVWRWRQRRARPDLAQAIAIQALFPWIPVAAWLTPEEREMVQAAYGLGQVLAAQPPPNPKSTRKKDRVDPRQVTLEEVIAMKVPPKPQPAPAPVILDEPDLGDWDASDLGAAP